MFTKALFVSSLLTAINAFTTPGAQTYGSLYTPNTQAPVTQGQSYTVTWQPTAGAPSDQTVSLVLCNGPSTNCVLQSTAIQEGIPAASGSYTWNVPCSLPVGTMDTATGYGLLIIVDGTGQFQYSTQFSVLAGPTCGAVTTTTTTTSSTTTSSSTTSSTTSSSSTSTSTTKTTTSSSSSSSSSITTSSDSATSSAPYPTGWYGWSSSMNATTVEPTVTAPAASNTISRYTTSAAATTQPTPKPYTGAASSLSTGFASLFIGIAAAVFAL